jgi:hypothetical protein
MVYFIAYGRDMDPIFANLIQDTGHNARYPDVGSNTRKH